MKQFLLSAIVFFQFQMCSALFGCSVPVFRYALERWPADAYDVFVMHEGTLSEEEQETVTWLEDNSVDSKYYFNYKLETVSINSKTPDVLRNIWKSAGSPDYPCIVSMYPRLTNITHIAWYGKLTQSNAEMLIDSPARREIAKNILDGQSGVWVLIESGNKEADDAAEDTLRAELENLDDGLLLPEQKIYLSQTIGEIHIKFSVLRITRSNPAESAFLSMLINCDPELEQYASRPIAFPVYGRGRLLYVLAGDEINAVNIYQFCAFLAGPCSCEFKAMNPGLDLLMCVNWEAGIYESWVANSEQLLFPGLSNLRPAASESGISDGEEHREESGNVSSDSVSAAQETKMIYSSANGVSSNSAAKQSDILKKAALRRTASIETKTITTSGSFDSVLKNTLLTIGVIMLTTGIVSVVIIVRKRDS